MLKSDIFKNLELGGSTISTLNAVADTRVGDGGVTGTADTVTFTGARSQYNVDVFNFTTANQGVIKAYKITDTVVGRNGSDIIVGVENFKFSNGTYTETSLLNTAPIITSNGGGATATVNIAENTTTVTTVTAIDPDVNQTLAYTVIGGADAAKFAINATTGALSFIAAPNFEAATDLGANNVYDVVVQVSDGIAVDTQALAVTVSNVNEAATGELHISGYTATNTAASLTATNTIVDPDAMTNVVQYQWQRQVLVGADLTWVNIAGATAATLTNQSNTIVRVTSSYTDPFGNYSFVSNETAFVTGNGNNNNITGSASIDYLIGLGGNDTLNGGAGNDTVDGGTGNDSLVASVNDGNDSYIGGAGTDTYNLSATAADATVNLTTGLAFSSQTGSDTLSGIENVTGGTGNNTMTDNALSNTLTGGNGNDVFMMTADNTLDSVAGGQGIDTLNYTASVSNLTINLAGLPVVFGSGTGLGLDVFSGIENFTGGAGNDNITGDNQANTLIGGGGNDSITGGQGRDVLVGGLGLDRFIFTNTNETGITAATRDVINDFLSGTDRIDLAAIDARTGGGNGGDQAFTWLGTGAITAANQNGALHYFYDSINNVTVIEASNDNDIAAEFQVSLIGNQTLTAGDFIL